VVNFKPYLKPLHHSYIVINLHNKVMGVITIKPVKNRLRQIRVKEYDMTATDFSAKLGVSVSLYSAWELGKAKPSLERALDVAKRLGKSVEDIWYIDD